jgi:exopolysaccharide biosynthesis polyprenyl glycosylphosphotransferase
MIRLFRVFVPAGTLTLLISETFWVTAAFVLVTFAALPTDPELFLLYENGIARILVAVLSMVVALHFHDLYSDLHVKSRIRLLQQLCMVAGIVFLVQGLFSYVFPDLRVPLHVMVPGCALAILVIFVWRLVFSAFVLQVVGREKVLLVGATPLLGEVGRYMQEHPEKGSQVIGYVTGDDPPGTHLAGGEVLGGLPELREIVEATRPNRIVVGVPEGGDGLPLADLLDLRYAGQVLEEAAGAFEKAAGRVCLNALRPGQLIVSGEYGPRSHVVLYQMAANRFLAFLGMVASLPLMLAAAAAVRLSSRGPVLNRHIRVGRDGRRFTLYKFRSMRGPAGVADIWAPKDDPRVTRMGRILRFTRVDELPQLFNVLRGDMAIIGPRAERPDFVERLTDLIPCYPQRHVIRPGITGWAQINLESDLEQDAIAKLEYDLYYIKNMSASLDIYILLHTVKAVVLSRGAD